MKFWIGTILKIALVGLCAAVGWKTCRLLDAAATMVATIGNQVSTETLPDLSANLNRTSAAVEQTAQSIDLIRTQANRLIIISAGVASNIEKTTRGMHDQEQAQIAYLSEASRSLVKLSDDADTAIVGVRPTLDSLNADLVEIRPVLASAQATLNSIPPVLAETEKTTKNLTAISDDGRKVADHYTAIILKPATKIKIVCGFLWHSALEFAGAASRL